MSLNIEYNNRYQISKHDWKKNGVTTAGYNYGHDSVGNRIWSENLVTSNKSELFSFDNADRLTSFKTGTLNANKDNVVAPTYSQSWNLDSIGNWAGFTDNGTSSTNTFSDTHEMTQFKGVTQTFDNNGNLTSDGVRTFKYDAFNRIIEVKIGAIILAEYQYDAFNRRVMKKVDADLNSSFETTVKFLYDGFRCIEELNGSDALTKEYVYGSLYIDEVILQRAGATDYYFTHDYRYSVTNLTNSAGSIVESYDYKVYGERTASGSGLTDVGYTGQRHDSETGLMYFKNRYYSTSMGSFVARDPKEYIDGMSMYLGYFGSDGVDPFGLVVILIHGVNTDAKWFSRAETGLKAFWKKAGLKEQAIVEFSWGDDCSNFGFSRKQGGQPNYATDSVEGIKSTSPNREYMVQGAKRMGYILNKLNSAKASSSSKEPIDVIAHSQGTILTLAALHAGSTLDNFIMQGSPLDVWNGGLIKDNDLIKAKPNIRGNVFNYWSKGDEWAYQKGGIGAHGNALAQESAMGWITNREFMPGGVINGYTLPATGNYEEFDHSEYMDKADFFENIHGKDLGVAFDLKLTENTTLIDEVRKWAKW